MALSSWIYVTSYLQNRSLWDPQYNNHSGEIINVAYYRIQTWEQGKGRKTMNERGFSAKMHTGRSCILPSATRLTKERFLTFVRKAYLRNPRVFVNTYLVPLFVSIFVEVQLPPASLPERKIDIRSCTVHNVLKTTWKWSSWSLIADHDGTCAFCAL